MSKAASPVNVNTLWARTLVDELVRCGVRHACISPGSRSTPLVLELGRRDEIDDLSIVDERSAGFVALGLAKATGIPALVVCTSGTAVANLFPAVCEANASGVPLMVLSADRPRELQGVGASQAMDQIKIFGDHLRAFYEVGQPETTERQLRYLRGLACRAFAEATGIEAGPVHLNLAFRKPLEPNEYEPVVVDGGDRCPSLRISVGRPGADEATIRQLARRLKEARRPLIFAGADALRPGERESVLDFATSAGVPVLAEASSGLRFTGAHGESAEAVVTCADVLAVSEFYQRQSRPDLIIRLGRAPILWATQAWMRELADSEHILIGPGHEPHDPENLASWHIRCDLGPLFESLNEHLPEGRATGEDNQWFEAHRRAEKQIIGRLRQMLSEGAQLDAPTVWHHLGGELSGGESVLVSNSMCLRDVERFLGQPAGAIDLYFNRGINGIDGIVSTGLGIAAASSESPTVIVLGDVALRHDLSALWLADELDIDATVVVIDNDGGAIFDYLPLAKICRGEAGEQRSSATLRRTYERHFRTSGRLPSQGLARSGLEIERPESAREFCEVFSDSLNRKGMQIIIVSTDAEADRQSRQALRQSAAKVVI